VPETSVFTHADSKRWHKSNLVEIEISYEEQHHKKDAANAQTWTLALDAAFSTRVGNILPTAHWIQNRVLWLRRAIGNNKLGGASAESVGSWHCSTFCSWHYL
jgi:hypothetical protein